MLLFIRLSLFMLLIGIFLLLSKKLCLCPGLLIGLLVRMRLRGMKMLSLMLTFLWLWPWMHIRGNMRCGRVCCRNMRRSRAQIKVCWHGVLRSVLRSSHGGLDTKQSLWMSAVLLIWLLLLLLQRRRRRCPSGEKAAPWIHGRMLPYERWHGRCGWWRKRWRRNIIPPLPFVLVLLQSTLVLLFDRRGCLRAHIPAVQLLVKVVPILCDGQSILVQLHLLATAGHTDTAATANKITLTASTGIAIAAKHGVVDFVQTHVNLHGSAGESMGREKSRIRLFLCVHATVNVDTKLGTQPTHSLPRHLTGHTLTLLLAKLKTKTKRTIIRKRRKRRKK
ncbi:hypothetical protein MOQ_004156 [Trypanosoma cruzi marinkellei]|uniref:Uncharacterized protein n=1 Tax=Trypanosoma cruzi marinkellei TaxID=85056 RepID=K2NSQ9_TRYCR|nr:hypothetical protein MOQ_006865 [Trypanosoma cruzi marinkellei]EKF32002.1 hypothetical protein MOQ_004156 [Trypanosoma cruzi marinkellei]